MAPEKKPAKKAAKKVAAKHAPQDEAANDMRRAYEHLGRVEILHALLAKHSATEVVELTQLAKKELTAGHMKHAADLLRAAEHLSFGALGSAKKDTAVDRKLVDAITREFSKKLEKAEDHWTDKGQHHSAIEHIYSAVVKRARTAFDAGAYRQALEFGRGAEALAHVHLGDDRQLSAGAGQHKLTH